MPRAGRLPVRASVALAKRSPAPRLRVSLIGDSVAASSAPASPPASSSPPTTSSIDARCAGAPRPVVPLARRGGAESARDVVAATPGGLGDVVVLVTGYNDDPRRFHRRRHQRASATWLAAGVRQVVWLDLRVAPALPPSPGAGNGRSTPTLAALDRASPVLRVAPWNAYSAGHDDWFFDPIHLRSTGAVQLARFIGAQVGGVTGDSGALCRPARLAGRAAARRARPAPDPDGRWPASSPGPVPWCYGRPGSWSTPGPTAVTPSGASSARAGSCASPSRAARAYRSRRPRRWCAIYVTQACGAGTVTVGGWGSHRRPPCPSSAGGRARVATTVPTGAFGRVCIRSNAQADVRVELLGWSVPA